MKYEIEAKHYSHFCKTGYLELENLLSQNRPINFLKDINKFYALNSVLFFLTKKHYLRLLTHRKISKNNIANGSFPLENMFHFSKIEIATLIRSRIEISDKANDHPLCPKSSSNVVFISKNMICDFESFFDQGFEILVFGDVESLFNTNSKDPLKVERSNLDSFHHPLIGR